ncbi:MAG: tetraacyldisaccharide 4'-kinase [Pseudomonadota bacterium]
MREPRFWAAGLDPWSREAAPLVRSLLTPFAMLYGAITKRRLAKAKPLRLDIPVICVGNLTAGGVGKSPLVADLRARLTEAYGLRVASLSRGYGGTIKWPCRVDIQSHTAKDVGDEPLMLACSGESWIGVDRAEAGLAMAKDGVEVIIMDDGFQNPGLHKDLSIIVVDSVARFGNGHVIPKGPLREPVAEGLKRADGVMIMGDGEGPKLPSSFNGPVLRARIAPTATPAPHPYVAFAGIGRPEKFFDGLQAAGADVRDSVPFPDHHVYTAADLRFLHRLAEERGARLITTEKDYVRLSEAQRAGILTFPVSVVMDDRASLDTLIAAVIRQVRHE